MSVPKPGAPACLRCKPRQTPRMGRASLLGVTELADGCACIVACGAEGCTGAPQPVIDRPTRAHTPGKVRD